MHVSSIMVCIFAGVFLGGGFWVFADGCIDYRVVQQQNISYEFKWVVPGLLTTAAMVALNLGVTPSIVVQKWEGRLWSFSCLTIAFIGIGLSIWILTADAIIGGGSNWAAISILVQTMLVTMGGLLFFIRDGCKTQGGSSDYTL
jgi:Uncharacterised protein family (UPF0220)